MNRIVIVLDESGSMHSIRKEAIDLFNQQIEAAKEVDARISLILFNHDVRTVMWQADASEAIPLIEEEYIPNGTTAMYDAVHQAIIDTSAVSKPDDDVQIVIISDGMENSSRKVDRNTLAEVIQERQSTNKWTFVYLGANQDLSKISKDLNIRAEQCMVFAASSAPSQDGILNVKDTSHALRGYTVANYSGQKGSAQDYWDKNSTGGSPWSGPHKTKSTSSKG